MYNKLKVIKSPEKKTKIHTCTSAIFDRNINKRFLLFNWPQFANDDRRLVIVISRLPFNPNNAGKSIKISGTFMNTIDVFGNRK